MVKDQKKANFYCTKNADANKIIVQNAVLFYNKCQKHRNKCMQDTRMQRNRMISQYKKLKTKVEQDKPPQVKLFVRRNKINVDRSSAKLIRLQIYNVKEVMKKLERLPKGEI